MVGDGLRVEGGVPGGGDLDDLVDAVGRDGANGARRVIRSVVHDVVRTGRGGERRLLG